MMFSISSLTEKIGLRSGATVAASAAGSGFVHWAVDMASARAQPATPNCNNGFRISPPNRSHQARRIEPRPRRHGEAYRKRGAGVPEEFVKFWTDSTAGPVHEEF